MKTSSVRGEQDAVGFGDDLAVVVDADGVVDLGGSGRDQVVDVLHGAVADDQVIADHHVAVVDRVHEEVIAQVGQRAVAVQEAVLGEGAGLAEAGDVAVVDRGRGEVRAAEGGQPPGPPRQQQPGPWYSCRRALWLYLRALRAIFGSLKVSNVTCALGALGGTRTPNLLIRRDLHSRPLPARSATDLLEYSSTVRSEQRC